MSSLFYQLLFLALVINERAAQFIGGTGLTGGLYIGTGEGLNLFNLGQPNNDDEDCESETTTPTPKDEEQCNDKPDDIIQGICGCGISNADMDDYTHSTTTDGERWPWLVSVYQPKAKKPWGTCSGTLIQLNYVLTTAKCLDGYTKDDIKVRHISKKGCLIGAAKLILHPTYMMGGRFHNDIALIKLDRSFNCTKTTRNICLPRAVYNFGQPNSTLVTGGVKNKNTISEGSVKILPDENACGEESDPNRFCTEDKDKTVCKGGIGGTGMQQRNTDDDKSFRIVGMANGNPEKCSDNSGKTPYTRVQAYSFFIQNNT